MADYYAEFYTDEVDGGVANGDITYQVTSFAVGLPNPATTVLKVGTDLKAFAPESASSMRYDFDVPSVGNALPATAIIESAQIIFYNPIVAIVDPGVGGGGDAGTGYFRVGHLENDGIWNDPASKGFTAGAGPGEYADLSLLPKATNVGSDAIIAGALYGDVFLGTVDYTPITFPTSPVGGNPHTAGDSNYLPAPEFTLTGLSAAITTRLVEGARRIAFIFDPYQVPAAAPEYCVLTSGDAAFFGLPLGWWGPKLQINYDLPKTGSVPGGIEVDRRVTFVEPEVLAAVSPEYVEVVRSVSSVEAVVIPAVDSEDVSASRAVESFTPEIARLVRQAIIIPVPPPPVVPPSIDPYTPGNPAPSNSFDFGALADRFTIETDSLMSGLLTDPNSTGFSFGIWLRSTPGNIIHRGGICGSSDSYTTYTEGTALAGRGTPPPSAIRFLVEDVDDAQPWNWTETAVSAGDDDAWHFVCCTWDANAFGSSRVRMYFDGVFTGLGGDHPGDLAEPWNRPFWIGKAYADDTGLLAFEGYLTHITLWDGPLTAAEALILYGGGLPPNLDTLAGFSVGLKFWYHPNDYTPAQGAVVTDHSGSGNHAKDAGVDWPVGVVANIPT